MIIAIRIKAIPNRKAKCLTQAVSQVIHVEAWTYLWHQQVATCTKQPLHDMPWTFWQ